MSQRLDYFKLAPDVAGKYMELTQLLHKKPFLAEVGHLVTLRASQINGCAFCLDMHVKEAKVHGERELRIYHISVWRESNLFNEKERAALEWTEAVTVLSGHGISKDVFNKVSEHLSEKELSDITYAVGLINLWNRLNIASPKLPGALDKMFGLEKAELV